MSIIENNSSLGDIWTGRVKQELYLTKKYCPYHSPLQAKNCLTTSFDVSSPSLLTTSRLVGSYNYYMVKTLSKKFMQHICNIQSLKYQGCRAGVAFKSFGIPFPLFCASTKSQSELAFFRAGARMNQIKKTQLCSPVFFELKPNS